MLPSFGSPLELLRIHTHQRLNHPPRYWSPLPPLFCRRRIGLLPSVRKKVDVPGAAANRLGCLAALLPHSRTGGLTEEAVVLFYLSLSLPMVHQPARDAMLACCQYQEPLACIMWCDSTTTGPNKSVTDIKAVQKLWLGNQTKIEEGRSRWP